MPQTNEKRWYDSAYTKQMNKFSSWSTMEQDRIINHDEILNFVDEVASEAERRGYERAMEEVKKASASSMMTLTPSVEPEPVLIIPKSFFEK